MERIRNHLGINRVCCPDCVDLFVELWAISIISTAFHCQRKPPMPSLSSPLKMISKKCNICPGYIAMMPSLTTQTAGRSSKMSFSQQQHAKHWMDTRCPCQHSFPSNSPRSLPHARARGAPHGAECQLRCSSNRDTLWRKQRQLFMSLYGHKEEQNDVCLYVDLVPKLVTWCKYDLFAALIGLAWSNK